MIYLAFVVAGNTPGAPSPELYKPAAKRFAETYQRFPAGHDHRLILINSNGGLTSEIAEYFRDIPHEVLEYRGSGWDIGAHNYAAFTLSAVDWFMGFSSWTHFRRPGWLKAFVEARDEFGDGLFGATSSFEKHPHIRGTAYFIRAGRIQRYPHGCNSREESFEHEAGENSLSTWCLDQGFGAWVVTPEKTVPLLESRSLENVFRKGDQSNIWIFDKHTELFERASREEREALTSRADFSINSIVKRTGLRRLLFGDTSS